MYGRVHVHDTKERERKRKKRQIRPQLHGARITSFEPGQTFVSKRSGRRRILVNPAGPPFFLFFIPRTIPLTWVLGTATISWARVRRRARSRRDKARERGSRRSICPVNYTRRMACRNAAAVLREGSGKSARDSRALSPSFRQRRAPAARHYRELFANTVRLIKKSARLACKRGVSKYMVASVRSGYFRSYPDALGGEIYLSRHFCFRSQLYRRSAAEWEVYLQFCNSSKKEKDEKRI